MILEANRISVAEARERLKASPPALLVCGYDDDRCRSIAIPGALTFPELNGRLGSVPKEQEIIFY
jgi:hypothetical protein